MLVIEKLEEQLSKSNDMLDKIKLLLIEFKDIRESVDAKEEELKSKFIGDRIYWAQLNKRYSAAQKTSETCDLCEGIVIPKNSRGQEIAKCGRCSGSGKIIKTVGKPEELYYQVCSQYLDLDDLRLDAVGNLSYNNNYELFRILETRKIFKSQEEASEYGEKLLLEVLVK